MWKVAGLVDTPANRTWNKTRTRPGDRYDSDLHCVSAGYDEHREPLWEERHEGG
ncbi:hypothetical protein [Amycolatopsis sp. FDAARGOS 1241]|uniref:hypothetical protein n=1 Tax=Amycolatopsis sp. FDAARGOS 1241 TaxID=2778070 RepID=UPI00194FCCD0|nr:hypothetical protein [Amycolatopsis sp. FDAARGOS 1241]QRP48593.1 hypothetical protein I6J71_12575 [Amycolatopsis sp. FDAARGOS 1241]